MSALLLALALAAAPSPAAGDCPPPFMALPRYPINPSRANVSGTALVLARIHDCGRLSEFLLKGLPIAKPPR